MIDPNYYYLAIDLACILVPFLASFYPAHPFYKQWKAFFISCLIVGVFFLIWDELFTQAGIWGFNPDYLTGIYVASLPLEEILFFICIPYSCVFTYFSLEYLLTNKSRNKFSQGLYFLFLAAAFVLVLLSKGRAYTLYTGVYLFFFLLAIYKLRKSMALDFFAYLLILPFFFASNGILTGSFLPEPIVWYNNAENLNIRIFTIPIEDSMYGLLLILANIQLFNFFRKNNKKTQA